MTVHSTGDTAPQARASSASTRDARPFDWTHRLCDTTGLGPLQIGAAAASGIFALFLVVEFLLDRQPIRLEGAVLEHSGEGLITLLLCVLLAYLIAASASAARAAPRVMQRLRPLLRGSPRELDELESASLRRPRQPLRWSGAAGAGIALLVPRLEPAHGDWGVYDWRHWTPESTWHRFLAPVLGWWMGRLIGLMFLDSLRHSRLAQRIEHIDLLDPGSLRPFAGFGLANALRLTGFVALFSFLLIDLERYALMVACIAALTVGSASAALIVPVLGLHRRLRVTKHAELAAVHAAIRGDASALRATSLAGRTEPPSLGELVAYRELVASTREWPFDAPTVFRFGLYLLIPLGSWLGGALVERLVDAALG